MGLTRFPNGVTVNSTTALQYSSAAGDGAIDCNTLYTASTASFAGNIIGSTTITVGTVSATGSVIAPNAGVFGVRIPIGLGTGGQYSVALTSALFVTAPTSGLRAPGIGVFELIWITGATANITGSIRVTATSVSTGTDLCTLSVGSGTTGANTVYTTIGAVSIAQATEFTVTSAIQATANSSVLMVNFITKSV